MSFIQNYPSSLDPTIEDSYRKQVSISGLPRPEKLKKKEGGFFGKIFNAKKTPEPKKGKESIVAPVGKMVTRALADTNVLALQLGGLGQARELATGEAAFCGQCASVLSMLSTVKKTTWICEFCNHATEIDLEPEERPTVAELDYLIEPAADSGASKSELVVFCVDISGSMCVTSEVEELQATWAELRGDGNPNGNNNNAALNAEGADQRLPGQRRGASYISRLACVKAALDLHLNRLQKQHPENRMCLVLFASEVTIVGDGSRPPVVIAGDRLSSREDLLEAGRRFDAAGLQSARDSGPALSAIIRGLEEGGSTALGPAVTAALGLCAGESRAEVWFSSQF